MKNHTKKYLVASSVLVGSCIGVGVLGIPYIAAQVGLITTLIYILFVGGLVYFVNLFLGEAILRTKGDHQLIGYVEKYLGKYARHIMEFAVIFGAYAALIAYMIGMGKSLSYLFFGNIIYTIPIGILIGIIMAYLLRGGVESLKKFEKIGVLIILFLLLIIIGIFLPKIVLLNLLGFNSKNIFLPFGVVLFALMSFTAVPQVKLVLKNNENLFKKVLFTGTITSIIFYSLFTIVVVGFNGINTPDIATLSLGPIFIILGMFTMFTSYVGSGDALRESFQFDERYSKNKSWALATLIPIVLFVLIEITNVFSFTKILSLGGIVSGGILAILALLMAMKAKKQGNRKPEYEVHSGWIIIIILILIFVVSVIKELF